MVPGVGDNGRGIDLFPHVGGNLVAEFFSGDRDCSCDQCDHRRGFKSASVKDCRSLFHTFGQNLCCHDDQDYAEDESGHGLELAVSEVMVLVTSLAGYFQEYEDYDVAYEV